MRSVFFKSHLNRLRKPGKLTEQHSEHSEATDFLEKKIVIILWWSGVLYRPIWRVRGVRVTTNQECIQVYGMARVVLIVFVPRSDMVHVHVLQTLVERSAVSPDSRQFAQTEEYNWGASWIL